jgi:hypothetical protein
VVHLLNDKVVLDFQAQMLDCAWLHQLCHILTVILLDIMPKRKLFNTANLGAWAKSMVTESTKENVRNCTEILKKLLTFRRLIPPDQHHPVQRRMCNWHPRASLSLVCKGLQLNHVSLRMLTNMVLPESKQHGPEKQTECII